MSFLDIILVPLFTSIFAFLAYVIRPYLTKVTNKVYYMPALFVKFFGAIAVGLIYQFYYGGGGDTYMYYELGTSVIWKAFLNDPGIALQLIFGSMEYTGEAYLYQAQIYTYGDAASYFVVRLGGLFSILSGNSYGAIALGFAFLSFFGLWKLFLVFHEAFPHLTRQLAFGILFLPSVFFWGSGLLKDSITLGALGFLFHSLFEIIEKRQRILINVLIAIVMVYIIQLVKIYIFLAFFPALIVWLYLKASQSITSSIVRFTAAPVLLAVFLVFGLFASQSFAEESHRYSFDKVLITAEETAQWNYYVSQQQDGSGYSLGDYDFSPGGLARKFIPAVFTAIFRPTIIEARNPVMLISALENLLILILLFLALFRGKTTGLLTNNLWVVSLLFVILFSFATGVTTYNFGALARYRIPMLPFLMFALIYVYSDFRERTSRISN